MSNPNFPTIPEDDTIEKFDFLVEALVEEAILHGIFGENETAINFHVRMLREAYQRALDRQLNVGKVVIEVLGGVAEITAQPEGVEVEILDHDNEAAEAEGEV